MSTYLSWALILGTLAYVAWHLDTAIQAGRWP